MRSRTTYALGLIALNTLNILDYLLTKTSLRLGAVELNFILPKEPLVFKVFLVTSGSLILYYCLHSLFARRAIAFLLTSYLLVVLYQLVTIFILIR